MKRLFSRLYRFCIDRKRATIIGVYAALALLNFGWTMWYFREFADNLIVEIIVTVLVAVLWPLYWLASAVFN